ncbi:MAG: hypothetical protein ACREU7_10225, partial [Burkholderiales bacterium]
GLWRTRGWRGMQLVKNDSDSAKVGSWSALSVQTKQHNQLVDITCLLNDFVKRSGVVYGSCYLFVSSPGAAILLTLKPLAALDSLQAVEFVMALEEMVERGKLIDPQQIEDRMPIDPRECAAVSEIIPIHKGKVTLRFGFTICLCEYDGPRELEILVKVEGD